MLIGAMFTPNATNSCSWAEQGCLPKALASAVLTGYLGTLY